MPYSNARFGMLRSPSHRRAYSAVFATLSLIVGAFSSFHKFFCIKSDNSFQKIPIFEMVLYICASICDITLKYQLFKYYNHD